MVNNTTLPSNLYSIGPGSSSSNPFVLEFQSRDPTTNDTNYPTQKMWLNTTDNNLWLLKTFSSFGGVISAVWILVQSGSTGISSFLIDTFTAPGTNPVVPTAGGQVTITGGQVAAGTTANVIQTDSLAANTYTIQVQRSQAVGTSTIGDNGVCHFSSNNFTVDGNGFVQIVGGVPNYTNVTSAQSPYTVLATDYYISVDCSAGAVILDFPNTPEFKREWIVKDRTGNASANNITLGNSGGVTFDGMGSYILNSNYQAVNILANATPTYEIF